MKIREGFVLRSISGSNVICAIGERSKEFKGIIELNDTSAFLFKKMLEGISTIDELAKELTEEYDVDLLTAKHDTEEFLKKMREVKIVE